MVLAATGSESSQPTSSGSASTARGTDKAAAGNALADLGPDE
jgi:hypothetical protein